MTYQEQLQTREWKAKRRLILSRDNNRCTKCNCERTKFLGLSQKFGIKSYVEATQLGHSVGTVLNEKNFLISVNKGLINTIPFLDEKENFSLENLKFAMQWTDPGTNSIYEMGGYRLVCFTTNVQETDKFPDLNIHHKYYLVGKLAWEYEDDALVTLCYKCHQEEHATTKTFVYAKLGEILYVAEKCTRCNGSGYLPAFNYYQSGVCFNCHGHGVNLK